MVLRKVLSKKWVQTVLLVRAALVMLLVYTSCGSAYAEAPVGDSEAQVELEQPAPAEEPVSAPEAAPAAGDYPNATLDIGFAHDDAGELVAESLTIPIHLVVE